MGGRDGRGTRRGAVAFAVVGVALSLAAATGPAAPADVSGFANGTASAFAQSIKLNPTAASLSVGVTFGISLAGYTNDVAKAESRGIDLGVIGTTLAAEQCDGKPPTLPSDKQPQPLATDSRDQHAATGLSSPESINGTAIPGIARSVMATPVPMAEAVTESAPVGRPGLFTISGARADAVTRVVGGRIREAVATSDIGAIDLAGGLVELRGLEWRAVHRSGGDQASNATFRVGSLRVAGTAVPVPAADPAQAFRTVNTVLAPLGFELRAPQAHVDEQGGVRIDPLVVAVVPAADRDAISAAVLAAAQPVRQAITDAVLEQSCENGTYITIADIVVGSITGAGSFSLELGGARAGSGEIHRTSLLGALPDDLPTAPLGAVPPPGPAVAAVPAPPTPTDPAGPGPRPATGPPTDRTEVAAARIVARDAGSRGGRLAAVGGGGLVVLAAVAEADRRKMRRAQRLIAPDA